MNKAFARIIPFALVIGAVQALASCGNGVGMTHSSCLADGEIDPALRDSASKTAVDFVGALLKPEAAPAYQYLAADLQRVHSLEVFASHAKSIQSSGPYLDLKIDHLYEPSLTGPGPAPVLCGQLSSSENWVSVEARPEVSQIHAVIVAQGRNNDWAATVWLAKESDGWRVLGYYFSMASMAGRYPADLIAEARDQDARGHALNAHMLYFAAASLVNRGPLFQLGLKQDAESGWANHKPPPELAGGPPFHVPLGDKIYNVENLTIQGIGKKLVLLVLYRDKDWNGTDNADAERRNREFLDAFVKAHPEFSETFGGVVARILPVGSERGWGTVFDAVDGYK